MAYNATGHAARAYLYQLLQGIFGVEPSDAQLELVAQKETLAACEEIESQGALCHAAENLASLAQGAQVDDLKNRYSHLFLGPGNLEAAPWESVYVGRERLLLQSSTIAVRHFYTSCGFIPREYPHVADDHIALELDFMKRLSLAAAEGDGLASATAAEFLEKHLGRWAQDFAIRVRETGGSYYAASADLLVALVDRDRQMLSS